MGAHDGAEYDCVVDQSGSGDYERIQAAIDDAKSFPPERIRILVTGGVYEEKVTVPAWNPEISLVGAPGEDVLITHDDHFDGVGRGRNSTFHTYTLKVRGNGFRARNLTVENDAGPDAGQAVALHVDADGVAFRDCRFLGNQDTVYVAGEGARQRFSECYIEGTTDFVFGSATAFFEDCTIHSKADSYITAAATPRDQPFGFVFADCTLTAAPDVSAAYLGRPWRDYAHVAFLRTEMGNHIRAEGWDNWSRPAAEETTTFAEYDSRGPGADGERVAWADRLSETAAKRYTAENVVGSVRRPADQWYVGGE